MKAVFWRFSQKIRETMNKLQDDSKKETVVVQTRLKPDEYSYISQLTKSFAIHISQYLRGLVVQDMFGTEHEKLSRYAEIFDRKDKSNERIEYRMVTTHRDDISELVEGYLDMDEGWELYGNPFYDGYAQSVCQALIRKISK
jgi:hypothetical protein